MAKIVFDNTRSESSQFQSGYIVSRGTKYVTVRYLTNIQGRRDLTYRLTFDEWGELPGGDDTMQKCVDLEMNGYEPYWRGHIIQ